MGYFLLGAHQESPVRELNTHTQVREQEREGESTSLINKEKLSSQKRLLIPWKIMWFAFLFAFYVVYFNVVEYFY